MADGLDVKSSAVDGIIPVGTAIDFSKSWDANESTKRDEKYGCYVVHQFTLSNCSLDRSRNGIKLNQGVLKSCWASVPYVKYIHPGGAG